MRPGQRFVWRWVGKGAGLPVGTQCRFHNQRPKGNPMSETFKPDAQTLNAITSAMGAIVMCIAGRMTPEQKAGVASDLAKLAAVAERNGDTVLETLLIDLHRAAK